jgi:WD40 repeat protein
MQKSSEINLLFIVNPFFFLYQSCLKKIYSLFQDSYPCRTLKASENVIGAAIQRKNWKFLTAQGRMCVMTVQRLLCVPGQTCLTARRYAISIISRRSAVFINKCINPSSSFIVHKSDGYVNQIGYCGSSRIILTGINHFVRVDKSPQTPLHATAFLTCQHTSPVVSSAIHHTKPFILTGSIDKTAKLWRMSADGRQVASVVSLVEHSGPVYSVAFHPTELLIATSSEDGTTKVWRMSDDGTEVTYVATLEGHRGIVKSVAFNPNFPIIATSCISDGTVKLWLLLDEKVTCVATLMGKKSHTIVSIAFRKKSIETTDTGGNIQSF